MATQLPLPNVLFEDSAGSCSSITSQIASCTALKEGVRQRRVSAFYPKSAFVSLMTAVSEADCSVQDDDRTSQRDVEWKVVLPLVMLSLKHMR